MGLFGGKDDTKEKIEELKARMAQQNMAPPPPGATAPPAAAQAPPQQQGWQPPQQPWQQPQQHYEPPQQVWKQPEKREAPPPQAHHHDYSEEESHEELGIILDLGEGMSLNLPIKKQMKLDEFLRVADRVRELKRIDAQQSQPRSNF